MSSKKYGDCPRCGADYHAYQFFGRWKKCYACGYDRFFEALVADVRRADKWGRSVSKIRRDKVAKYQANLTKIENVKGRM